MRYLNAQQLAFLLDIKKEDARAMMCNAWAKHKGMEKIDDVIGGVAVAVPRAKRNKLTKKVEDDFPLAMPIDMLSKELIMPDLQMACDDIEKNYLERKATRRYIMWDYPEKQIAAQERAGKLPPFKCNLPPALKSMLPDDVQMQILKHWREAHKLAV